MPEYSHAHPGHRRIDLVQLPEQTLLIGTSPATAVALCRAHGFEPGFAPPASDVVTATLLAAMLETVRAFRSQGG